jgi:hypothetical protein
MKRDEKNKAQQGSLLMLQMRSASDASALDAPWSLGRSRTPLGLLGNWPFRVIFAPFGGKGLFAATFAINLSQMVISTGNMEIIIILS